MTTPVNYYLKMQNAVLIALVAFLAMNVGGEFLKKRDYIKNMRRMLLADKFSQCRKERVQITAFWNSRNAIAVGRLQHRAQVVD